MNALWDSKVKFDELSLKLTGKTDKEIRETLTRRYKFAIRRLAQTNSEDVFSLAMTAFAREIDPHTNYLSPRNTEQFNTEMSLSLEGIGAVLQMDDDYTVINSMVAGGPAAKSKAISVGDKIVGVGQTGKPMVDVIGWRLDDVVALIKGPKGSKVRLEILPAGKGTKTRTVTLTRERIRLEDRAVKMSVKTVGKEKVGVLDIPGFYVGLTDDVKVQLQKLEKQNVSSVIIDLRSNGGGALTEAVSLSVCSFHPARLFRSAITTARFVKTATPTDRSSIKARWWCWLTASVLRLQKSLPRQCRITVVPWLWVNRHLVKAPFSSTVH